MSRDRGAGRSREHGGVRLLRLSPPDTLDPTYVNTSFGYMLMRVLCRTLVTQPLGASSDGWQPVLDLADDLVRSPDGLRYSFHLPAGLRYGSGAPLCAADFRLSIERALRTCAAGRPAPSARLFWPIAGSAEFIRGEVGALAGMTEGKDSVHIRLTSPAPDFLHRLTLPLASPLPTGFSGNGLTALSGPYQVGSLAAPGPGPAGYRLRLVRNKHWQPETDPVRTQAVDYIDVVMHRGDTATAAQAVISGQADCFGLVQPGQLAEAQGLLGTRSGHLHLSATNRVFFLAIRADRKPFDRADVRQAVAACLDKQRILDSMGGVLAGEVAENMVPPGLRDGDGAGRAEPGAARVEAARTLLAEALAGQEAPISLLSSTAEPDSAAGRVIADTLIDLGARVSASSVSFDSLYRLLDSDSAGPDLALAGWLCDYPDPVTLFPPLFSSGGRAGNPTNYGRLRDSELDRLIGEAAQCAEPVRRHQLWKMVNTRVAELSAIVPLMYPKAAHLVSDRLQRYAFSPMSASPDLARISIRPECSELGANDPP